MAEHRINGSLHVCFTPGVQWEKAYNWRKSNDFSDKRFRELDKLINMGKGPFTIHVFWLQVEAIEG